ncbi:NADPH-dependent FMN reductase [Cryptosporangium minutisporangium]|uniref:NAD(P)H-dependent oxidoreductase n=1 Tax=Cryptosporangium minutisporangium TaxID=113569 RepID=A0ABP6TAW7_9ACTN
MLKIAIILGSTRPGRNGEAVAHWVLDLAQQRTDATFELVDLADHHLPAIDEPVPPARGVYTHEHTKSWARTIARYQGYVLVTPEYNHSAPGALKNALDRVHGEWANKAAGFVSYGVDGGVRAVEQLRLTLSALQIAHVTAQVSLSLWNDFANFSEFTPAPHQQQALTTMLDQLISWSAALAPLHTTADPVPAT